MAYKVSDVQVKRREYLRNISHSWRIKEGDCPEAEQAWVECKQLTFGEEAEVEGLRGAWQIMQPINFLALRRKMVFYSLAAAGNILNEAGKELFKWTSDGLYGGEKAFMKLFDTLDRDLAHGIIKLALFVNPAQDRQGMVTDDALLILNDMYPEIHAEVEKEVEERAEKKLQAPQDIE